MQFAGERVAARELQSGEPMQPLDTIRWRLLTVLHFFIGATALIGGGLLVVWWNGRMLDLSVTILERSPFTDFLLPGLMLYAGVGVTNMIACYLVTKREPGAELISFIAGMGLLIWIAVETAVVNASNPMQLVYGALALVVVLDAVWIRRTRAAGHPFPALAR